MAKRDWITRTFILIIALSAIVQMGCSSPIGNPLPFSKQPHSIVITRYQSPEKRVVVTAPEKIREITSTLNRIRGNLFMYVSFVEPPKFDKLELIYDDKIKSVNMSGQLVAIPDIDDIRFYGSAKEAREKLAKIVEHHLQEKSD